MLNAKQHKMKRLFPLLAIVFFFTDAAHAQIGLEVGGSYNIQNGTFVAPCGCTFANGVGIGFTGAVPIDLISLLGITIGIEPGFESQSFKSSEVDPTTLAQIASGDRQSVNLAYLTVEPYLRYTIPHVGLFLQVAPGWNYLLSSSFHHTIGGTSDDGSPNYNADTTLSVRQTRYDAKLSAGYTIGLLGISIQPTVSVALPLTDLSTEQAANWHVTAIYFSVGLRF
jgi:hypothetical protein